MTITYHTEMVQGSDEWHAARCGLLTASQIGLILTPTLKIASNDKERANLYELLAQRITRYVEPSYISSDMLRGLEDEVYARALYNDTYAPVTEVGFVTNDRWGFTIGYSPDGLVGEDGMIEVKSRVQKYQVQTIIENVHDQTAPQDYMLQLQTGLLVTERKWIDFISYCGGIHMATIRVFPEAEIQEAIIKAATEFEARLDIKWRQFKAALASVHRLVPTERRVENEMYLG